MSLSRDEMIRLDELKQKQHALLLLQNTPGWQILVNTFLKVSAKKAYSYAITATTGTEMGKHLGAFNTLEQIAVWPEEEIKALALQIKMIESPDR